MSALLSEREIKQLFEQNYLGLVEFSSRMVRNKECARDLVQDVFFKLLNNKSSLAIDRRKVKSYLYSMVRNASLNYLKRKNIIGYIESDFEEVTFSEENVLESMIYSESINRLHEAIATLPEACQKICNLTYIQGKSNQEAADITNVSINTVKTHKRRAVEILRRNLKPVLKTIRFFVFIF